MEIKVLGAGGCRNCTTLEGNVREALSQLGLEAQVTKVVDMAEVMSYGIMRTPGLVVDGTVKSYGRVLTVDEVKQLLRG